MLMGTKLETILPRLLTQPSTMNRVSPTTRVKTNSTPASSTLMSDRILMPLARPNHTLAEKMAVQISSTAISSMNDGDTPSRPLSSCDTSGTASPSEVPTPPTMPNTTTASRSAPHQPSA